MDVETTLRAVYRSHANGEWEGETPTDAIMRWANCKHAELHPDGSVYIEDPQAGHYLSDDKAEALCDWLSANGLIA